MQFIYKIITSKKFIRVLVLLNIFTAFISFYLADKSVFMDSKSYWAMAESIGYGKFSAWYQLPTYYPDTLRTMGYPVFVFFCRQLFDNELFVKIIQLAFYFYSLFLALKILAKLTNNVFAKPIFLALTAISIQIPYYAGYISSDSINIFFVTLYLYYLLCKPQNTVYALVLGLIGAAIFQIRPAFLLFPFALTFLYLFRKQQRYYFVVHLLVFVLSLISFSVWNYQNHGVFKPTPLEGGGGVAHLSYWSMVLPQGYTEQHYWQNTTGYDLTQPSFASDEEREKNVEKFNQEWFTIKKDISKYLTSKDSIDLATMQATNPAIFLVYNSQYTQAREKLLWKYTLQHIKENPTRYLMSRVYIFCRLYFTGINVQEWQTCNTVAGYVKMLYPFLVTFIFIFLGLLVSLSYFLYKKISLFSPFGNLLFISFYYSACHVAFTIQSRYTVPIHLAILILLAYIATELFSKYIGNSQKS
jgi:hypothetical protein